MEILKKEQQITFCKNQFKDGNILPQYILEAFQSIAISHANELGVGFDAMMKKNQIWVLSKIKYEIISNIEPDKNYTLITYPKKKNRLTFDRDYYIFDGENMLVKATSVWCVIDYVKRSLVKPDFDFEGNTYEQTAFCEPLKKINLEQLQNVANWTIKKQDIDNNNHTNNIVYSKMITDVLKHNNIKSLQINFVNESVLGDMIDIFIGENNTICGKINEDVVFSAIIEN